MTDAGFTLKGKRVVVIGGTSGIGHAVASASLELGAQVVVASSNKDNVDAAVARLSGATGGIVDVKDEHDLSHFFRKLGAFDHLVVTAGDWGGTMFAPTLDIELSAARQSFEVRFWGALAAVKHSIGKVAPDGSITLTSGMLSHRPTKGAAVAAALGGAVEHLVGGLAVDLAPVRVNAVCPGLILTDRVKQMPEERLRAYVERLPLPRTATPREAAAAYVYSMLNGYVTGQILPVDGGGWLV